MQLLVQQMKLGTFWQPMKRHNSGQQINLDKSVVVFSRNTCLEDKDAVKNILGDGEAEKHDKYLGLPAVTGKSKKEVFDNLRERVWKKIKGWKEKLLSRAGK